MKNPDIPKNETQRIEALESYSILDTLEEEEYDAITAIAAEICGTKISLISLVDSERQWFKSKTGVDADQTPREFSFCAHAINDPENIFQIEDARNDERFSDNPLVTGEPHVIFYAGMPLVDSTGYSLGSLCVIDDKPNKLNENQIFTLKALSKQVIKLLELRKANKEKNSLIKELELNNKALSQFAKKAAHDLKSPLNSIIPIVDVLNKYYGEGLDKDAKELLDLIKRSAQKLNNLIDGILEYSNNIQNVSKNKTKFVVNNVLKDIVAVFKDKAEIKTDIAEDITIKCNKVVIQQILLNLISNSIRYNDKDLALIEISIKLENNILSIKVKDNGMGIPKKDQSKIFMLFHTTKNKTQDDSNSTGIGLATVKSLVDAFDGEIKLESEVGVGTEFDITLKLN